jgi:hemerythrin-like domain-containing protein
MNPTGILREEHEHILVMLDVVGAVCDRLERGEKVDAAHLAQIIDFIRGFADGCHHAKEEHVLFPALEAAGIPREGGPIGVMLHEHVLGRNFVKNMDASLAGIGKGDAAAARSFVENARGYAQLLANHIHKENNVLFVMADQHLSPIEQERVGAEFDRVEREETGEGVHEKYHAMLHALRDAYLD